MDNTTDKTSHNGSTEIEYTSPPSSPPVLKLDMPTKGNGADGEPQLILPGCSGNQNLTAEEYLARIDQPVRKPVRPEYDFADRLIERLKPGEWDLYQKTIQFLALNVHERSTNLLFAERIAHEYLKDRRQKKIVIDEIYRLKSEKRQFDWEKRGPTLIDGFNVPLEEYEFPHRPTDPNGKIPCTLENVQHLLGRYGITTDYNQITKRPRVALPGSSERSDISEASQDAAFSRIVSQARLCRMNEAKDTVPMTLALAYANPFNPVVDALSGYQWDGKDHIQMVADLIDVPFDEKPIRDLVFRLWVTQCAAAADHAQSTPNRDALTKFEHVFLPIGAQGAFKTKFLRNLLPQELQPYFLEGAILDLRNKDSLMEATKYWIVELGELDATFKASDIAQLKAFLSKLFDIYRVPYGRTHEHWPRRTSYCASANVLQLLRDKTGNRRFWPLTVQTMTLPTDAGIDLQQLWAQAWNLYLSGKPWWPTKTQDDMLNRHRLKFFGNRNFEGEIFDRISDTFYLGKERLEALKRGEPTERLTTSKVIEKAYNNRLYSEKPSTSEVRSIHDFLTTFNFNQYGVPDYQYRSHQHHWIMAPKPLWLR